MSDFGELCPLFNTGMFHEIVFPGPIALTDVGTLQDLLAGTANQSGGALASGFMFGRTVIVTEAFIQNYETTDVETSIYLKHKTSGTQACAGTIIGTCTLPVSGSAHGLGMWKPMVSFVGKTFTSNEVLALVKVSTNDDSGSIGLMVRYKDK